MLTVLLSILEVNDKSTIAVVDDTAEITTSPKVYVVVLGCGSVEPLFGDVLLLGSVGVVEPPEVSLPLPLLSVVGGVWFESPGFDGSLFPGVVGGVSLPPLGSLLFGGVCPSLLPGVLLSGGVCPSPGAGISGLVSPASSWVFCLALAKVSLSIVIPNREKWPLASIKTKVNWLTDWLSISLGNSSLKVVVLSCWWTSTGVGATPLESPFDIAILNAALFNLVLILSASPSTLNLIKYFWDSLL